MELGSYSVVEAMQPKSIKDRKKWNVGYDSTVELAKNGFAEISANLHLAADLGSE